MVISETTTGTSFPVSIGKSQVICECMLASFKTISDCGAASCGFACFAEVSASTLTQGWPFADSSDLAVTLPEKSLGSTTIPDSVRSAVARLASTGQDSPSFRGAALPKIASRFAAASERSSEIRFANTSLTAGSAAASSTRNSVPWPLTRASSFAPGARSSDSLSPLSVVHLRTVNSSAVVTPWSSTAFTSVSLIRCPPMDSFVVLGS